MSEKLKSTACYVKALAEMKNAELDKENPHYKSKYSTYGAVRDATNEALANNDLGLAERTAFIDDKFVLLTEVRHVSGDIVNVSWFPISLDAKIQQKGSEITYARRYNRTMLCGISSGEDEDDGNEAQVIKKTKTGWKGPLNKTALKEQIHDICNMINKLTAKDSEDHLNGIWRDWKPTLNQAKSDNTELYQSAIAAAENAKKRINDFPGDTDVFGLPPSGEEQ